MSDIDIEANGKVLIVKTRGFNTATINGLRRAMLLRTPCLGFVEEIDPEDYAIITGTKPERRNTVLANTISSQSTPVLAHRCSRLAIHTNKTNKRLLRSDNNRKVFFVICAEDATDMKSAMTEPYVNKDSLSRSFYSRDFRPVVLVKKSVDDDTVWEYDEEQSNEIVNMINNIFRYNELVAEVHFNQRLNIVLKPVLGTGITDARWSPCTFKYQFMMDPQWLQFGQHLIKDGQVRRKIEGQCDFRYLFTHKPTDRTDKDGLIDAEPYNLLGKPYGHILMFQYNGKMSPRQTFLKAIRVLDDAVGLFLKRYGESEQEDAMMSKEKYDVSSNASTEFTLNSHVEMLYIPKNTQDPLPEGDLILTDHTIGNLITTKMLEIVSGKIDELDDRSDLWRQTHIAYKVPHPLIKQCVILIKVPAELNITHGELVASAVEAIRIDLHALRVKISEIEDEDIAEDQDEDIAEDQDEDIAEDQDEDDA